MLGWLVVAVLTLGLAGWAWPLVRRLTPDGDPAANVGFAGLIGLGGLGTLTLFLGLLPLPIGNWTWVIAIAGGLGIAIWVRNHRLKLALPKGGALAGLVVCCLAVFFALVGSLAPSDALDWDTLSYHLAVPKLWLESGRIERIPFIHHSNFPFAVDNLYIWGLALGGASGAKLFSVAFLVFGLLAVFGTGRRLWGENAGWWAAVVFVTVPVVLWESGTGYIDVAHGLYAGLGAFVTLEGAAKKAKGSLVLGAILLGLAIGSKYTGLQALLVVGLLGAVLCLRSKWGWKEGAVAVALALAIGAPWYVRNVFWSGNPVFPFFYERLGGSLWDQRRADIYRNEQQTFGVGWSEGRLDKTQIGHAVLGLGYQPGRFVNPGQQEGRGFPMGAVGVAVLGGLVAAGLRRRTLGEAGGWAMAYCGLSLVVWFLLSQQSRYIVALAPPLALLGGAVLAKPNPLGRLLSAFVVAQAAYSLWLLHTVVVSAQLPVVFGRVDPADYLQARVPFFAPSETINEAVGRDGKVALYDEVFGYFLDVPYFWANPGHSTIIPYDSMADGSDYVEGMRKLGFTHVYVNLQYSNSERRAGLLRAFSVPPETSGNWEETRKGLYADWQTKWFVLIANAAENGLIVPVASFGNPENPSAVLFEIKPEFFVR